MKSSFNFIQTIKVVALAMVLAFGIQYATAQTWTGPSGSPPGNNTPSPLNVGPLGQIKTGGITVGSGTSLNAINPLTGRQYVGFGVQNGAVELPLKNTSGNPTAQTDYVLTAADTQGKLKWSPPAGGGGGGTNNNFYNDSSLAYPLPHSQNIRTLSNGGLTISGTSSPGQFTNIAISPAYKLPINCSVGQVPKMTGPTTWSCANDNGGSVSVSTSCTYVYGSGSSAQDMNCPANNVMAGTKVADTNSSCSMGSSNPNCGARVVAIKCCPIN